MPSLLVIAIFTDPMGYSIGNTVHDDGNEDVLNDRLRCPRCGSADVRNSVPRGVLDNVSLSLLGGRPVRCRSCRLWLRTKQKPEKE